MGVNRKSEASRTYLGWALGATVAGGVALAPSAEADPFRVAELGSGYQVADKGSEGRCGGQGGEKAGEGRCGGEEKRGHEGKKDMEGKCAGKEKDKPEGKKPDGKCGEGKCASA